jgi:uncharacterized protein
MDASKRLPCFHGLNYYWVQGLDPFELSRPKIEENKYELADGMEITWDVPVKMRDGVIIYIDIFRPTGVQTLLPIIFTFSPYGKHGPKTLALFPDSGVPPDSVSRLGCGGRARDSGSTGMSGWL